MSEFALEIVSNEIYADKIVERVLALVLGRAGGRAHNCM